METLLAGRREPSSLAQQHPSLAGSSAFVGPLALIYCGGRIKRRSRYTEEQWEDAMGADNNFSSYEAEKSGNFPFPPSILMSSARDAGRAADESIAILHIQPVTPPHYSYDL